MLRIRLLGGFEIVPSDGGATRALPPRLRWLLAVLAAEAPRPVRRQRLAELLWGDGPPQRARSSLRQALHDLRAALGPDGGALVADKEWVRLAESSAWVDAIRFAAIAGRRDPASLDEAARLFRGEPLAGLEPDGIALQEWRAAVCAGALDLACGVLAGLASAAPGSVASGTVVALARRLLAIDPALETAHRALIDALAASGRPQEALAQFEQCRRALRRDLDVAPSAPTLALVQRIAGTAPTSVDARPRAPGDAAPSAAAPVADPVALDHFLRGRQLLFLSMRPANRAARRCYEAALALDGRFAAAHVALGWTHFFDYIKGWSDRRERCLARAGACAARALQLDDRSATALGLRGKVLLWSHEPEAALWALRRACELQPEDAFAWFHLGDGLCWSGRPAEGLSATRRSLRMQSEDFGFARTIEATCLWMLDDAERAAAAAASALVRNPSHAWAAGLLAILHAEAGRRDQARHFADLARRRNQSFSLDYARQSLPAALPQWRARIVAGWRAAGLPETT